MVTSILNKMKKFFSISKVFFEKWVSCNISEGGGYVSSGSFSFPASLIKAGNVIHGYCCIRNPKTCVKLVPIIQKEEIKKSKSSMQLESTQRVDFTPKEITQQKAFLKVPKENKDCWHFFEKPLNCNPTSTSKVRNESCIY